ncbi:MAG: CHC2 zinc finger domain-containing protein [Planctomycetaceae bacterium]
MKTEQAGSREQFIIAVRKVTDFERTASRYDRVVQQGLRAFACCPNHDDRSPSLSIDHSQQVGRCWMCLAKGNVFWLVMAHERICFRDAVQSLARLAGLEEPVDIEWLPNDLRHLATVHLSPSGKSPLTMRSLEVPRRLRV